MYITPFINTDTPVISQCPYSTFTGVTAYYAVFMEHKICIMYYGFIGLATGEFGTIFTSTKLYNMYIFHISRE